MNVNSSENRGFSWEIPPSLDLVKIYFIQKGASESEAERFYSVHQNNNWKTVKGRPIRYWKGWANEWIWRLNTDK
ncbi:hypothetical protein [Algoriphagus pacificus]|uniref:Uncharacterized protein n=1 Tax=Algoriphagus pacificus TaxID=2811234 RepID=A0ABS3CLW0_9BACT|nr:hypothetical protein [Algoriphagus pacificus]MBN7818027.1 hypothetical protein [Algoriphagus pacificus]